MESLVNNRIETYSKISNFWLFVKVATLIGVSSLIFPVSVNAATFTVSGTLYNDTGSSAAASGYAIKLAVGTSTPAVFAATTTSGAFSFTGISDTGITSTTPFTLWIDATTTLATTLVMGYAGGGTNITAVPMYIHNTVAHGTSSIAIVDLAEFDFYDSSDDSDIMVTVVGVSATTSSHFLINQGTLKATTNFVVQGNYTNRATFDNNSGTIKFNNYISYEAGMDVSGNDSGSQSVAANTVIRKSNYVFVGKNSNATPCSQTAGSAVGCELLVFDISSSTNISLTTSRDAAGTTNGTAGINIEALALSEDQDYLFIGKGGSTGTCNNTTNGTGCELLVFDISTPSSPTFVAARDANGTSNGAAGVTFNYLKVDGNYLYVGKAGSSGTCSSSDGTGCEIMVFNITTPTSPSYVNGRDADGSAGGATAVAINEVAVKDNALYIAKDSSSTACSQTAGSAIGCELMIFEISSSTNPIYVTGLDQSASATGTVAVAFVSLTVSGDYLFLGSGASAPACAQTIGSATGCEMQIYNISSTTNPVYVVGRDISGTADGTGADEIWRILQHGDLLYLSSDNNGTTCSQTAGSAIGCEFQVYNFASTTNPVFLSSLDVSGVVSGAEALQVDDFLIYNNRLYTGSTGSARVCVSSAIQNGCEFKVFTLPSVLNSSMTGSSAFNNLTIAGAGAVFNANASTTNLTLENGTTTATSGVITIAGNYDNDARFNANNGEVVFSGSSKTLDGSLVGDNTFNKLTISGSVSFSTSTASTTHLTINSGGTLTAPSYFGILGDYANNGTFTHNSGEVIFTDVFATSTKIGGDGLASSWSTSYGSVYDVQEFRGDIYATLAFAADNAEVWKYDGSTWSQIGGDGLNSSWSSTTEDFDYAREITVLNDSMYVSIGGHNGEAEVWRYNGSSWSKIGGDGVNSSWATTTYEQVWSLTTHDNKLYAGLGETSGSDADVWEWNGTDDWAQIGGDATSSSWTGGTFTYAQDLISYAGKLYAGLSGGTAGDAEVWEYSGSSWSKVGGDGTNFSWNTSYEYVQELDVHNGKLYAGLGSTAGDAEVWEYSGSSWSKIGGDGVNSSWATSTNYEYAFALESHAGRLYAGTGWSSGDADLWEYHNGFWTQVGNDNLNRSWDGTTHEAVTVLRSIEGDLYAGLGFDNGDAEVWRFPAPTNSGTLTGSSAFYNVTVQDGTRRFSSNASTTNNVYIATSSILTAPSGALTIAGNYNNRGSFEANNGEVIFSGSSKTINGTLTGDSSFYTLSVSGTPTFSTSTASTTNLTIRSGGTFTAPSYLGISGDYTNSGTFTHNSSELIFTGLVATTTKIGGDGLNSSWPSSNNELQTLISYNGKLLANVASGSQAAGVADVWEWNGSSWTQIGGDGLNSSWAASTYERVQAMAVYNGRAYVGIGQDAAEAEVWSWNGTVWAKEGGDGVNSSWSAASNYDVVSNLYSDGTYLYAGLGWSAGDGVVWRYDGFAWTKIGGDTVNSSWSASVYTGVEVSTYRGKVYAGLNGNSAGDAEVWEFNGTNDWTLIGGDGTGWVASTYEGVTTMETDGNYLYAGLNSGSGDAEVYRYNGSSWTKIGGDGLNASWNGSYGYTYVLHNHNGFLYAGIGIGDTLGELWAWDGTYWLQVAGDGINGSWASSTRVHGLATHDGYLYAGLARRSPSEVSGGDVWQIAAPSISGTLTGSSVLGNLKIDGSVRFANNASTSNLIINGGVAAPDVLTIAGNYDNDGSFDANSGEVIFSGSSKTLDGYLTGDNAFYTLSVSGTPTFSTSTASTTNLTIRSGGTLTAPSHLGISGDYTNNGTFTANSGTVYFENKQYFFGTKIGGDGLGWADSTYEYLPEMIDHNGKLYGGLGVSATDGELWEYDGSSWTKIGGDGVNSSWTTYFVLALKSYGGNLYVGTGGGDGDAEVWKWDGSTWTKIGGDSVNSGWDSTYDILRALEWHNGKLYAGLGQIAGDAEVWEFNGTNDWTKIGGDGTGWADSTFERVERLISYNGDLYAGLGISTAGFAEVWRYDGSSWTKVGGDGTGWADSTFERIYAFAVHDGYLYAGLGQSADDAEVWRYNGSSWTKIGGDSVNSGWTSGYEVVASLVTHGGKLYAGLGWNTNEDEVWEWNGSSWRQVGGDSLYGTWSGKDRVFSLASSQGNLYAGLGSVAGDAEVWKLNSTSSYIGGSLVSSSAFNNIVVNGSVFFENNASTSDLTINASSSLTAPAGEFTVSSDFTDNGFFDAKTGEVVFTGTTNTIVPRATTTFFALTKQATATSTLTITTGKAVQVLDATTLSGVTAGLLQLRSSSDGSYWHFDPEGSVTVSRLDVKDSNNISGTTINCTTDCGDSGHNVDWNFYPDHYVSLDQNYTFYIDQATTTLGALTVVASSSVANDIRINIATTTTNFLFDTSVTSPTISGTGSGKVSGTVSYENNGATLVINVTTAITTSDTLTITGLKARSFSSVSTTTSQLRLFNTGSISGTAATSSVTTFRIVGLASISAHSGGQVSNEFGFQNDNDAPLLAFRLGMTGENATVTDMVVSITGLQNLTASNLSDFKLYRDNDSDLVLDGGDTLLDGAGILTITGQNGAVTFSSDFLATTTATNYIMTADTASIDTDATLVFTLLESGLTATGVTSSYTVVATSTNPSVQHNRYRAGGGGGGSRVGGDAPAGDGDVGGGGSGGGEGVGEGDDGENISDEPEFNPPTTSGSPNNEWTNGSNALASDGTYATAVSAGLRQAFSNFGFSLPGGNTIQGIEVKVDASGTTAAGTLQISLSWDSGSSFTTVSATPTLSGSDVVYLVGGPSDLWGRGSWSVSEVNDTNFRLRVTAQPSSNTVRLDAVEVRVYHQAGGGGAGGGGGI